MKNAGRGFSLIELLITLAILGVLLALGASSYRTWISNMRVRTTAEAIQNGLQLARGEAVRRNTQIRFQLTSTTGSDCIVSPANADGPGNWLVSFAAAGDDVTGKCNAALLNEAFAVDDAANNPPPRIVQGRSASDGSRDVVVNASQTALVFTGMGRLASNPATNPVVINVGSPAAGNCIAAGGNVRCLAVTITVGGQVRMCDPAYAAGGTDPQRCTAAG